MIGIVDYGLGNIRSVAGAMEHIGQPVCISSNPRELELCTKLILPGVGAFGDGMDRLNNKSLIEPLNRMIMEDKKPILGICLGFQLMTKQSMEFGSHKGLGLIDAEVENLDSANLRLPHVGWNDCCRMGNCILFNGISEDALFYYVHSYHVSTDHSNIVCATCNYGDDFVACIQVDNIYGTQFHPEKSQQAGLQLLNNFCTLA